MYPRDGLIVMSYYLFANYSESELSRQELDRESGCASRYSSPSTEEFKRKLESWNNSSILVDKPISLEDFKDKGYFPSKR